MLETVKKYLLYCLICLQIVVPFIHAHEFGHDSYKEHIFHFHTDEISNVNNANTALGQAHVSENQIIGAITTVASGIKTSLADHFADDIALIAILFSFVLLIFNLKSRFVPSRFQTANYQRIAYSLHHSRAPPR
ncbi:MAG: hypothetical protein H7Z20_00730 [Bdellovibrio sp.]|nr:hypothetical protein [Methylotenera sp.]